MQSTSTATNGVKSVPVNGIELQRQLDQANVIELQRQLDQAKAALKSAKDAAKTPAFEPSVELTEFKGNKMLRLRSHAGFEKYPFQFGLKKARLILALIPEIKKFAESDSADAGF